MPHEEVYGERCSSYSVWHRRKSITRYVAEDAAEALTMVDIDAAYWIEASYGYPVALVETAVDVGQTHKTSTILQRLGSMCDPVLPVFVLLYKLSEKVNPADGRSLDIESFRYKPLTINAREEWTECTPQQWAEILVLLRGMADGKADKHYKEVLARERASEVGQLRLKLKIATDHLNRYLSDYL